MKLNMFAPVFLAASGLAFAQAPASAPDGDSAGKSVTHKFKVEVVSTDVSAKTLTVVKAMGKSAEFEADDGRHHSQRRQGSAGHAEGGRERGRRVGGPSPG